MGAEFIFCSLCFGLDFQTKRQNQGPNLCYPLGHDALQGFARAIFDGALRLRTMQSVKKRIRVFVFGICSI